jgi:hypothetical protein
LVPSGHGNRRGHFEDLDFYVLHEQILESRGGSAFVVPPDVPGELRPEEEEAARALIGARQHKALWGFKDPRATLFLPLWNRLLPNPFFVLLYRHPVEVALSLLRRGIDAEVAADPWAAIRTWTEYNRRLLGFYLAHRERCLLWGLATFVRTLDSSMQLLSSRLGVSLVDPARRSRFHPAELRQGLAAPEIDWSSLLPEALDLYRALEQSADLAEELPWEADQGLLDAHQSPDDEALANEYLLHAALGARPQGKEPAPPVVEASLRVEFSDLRLRIAQQEQTIAALRQELHRAQEQIEQSRQEADAARAELSRLLETRAMRLARAYWALKLRLTSAAWGLRRKDSGRRASS